MNYIDFHTGFGMVIAIIGLITIILWIFMPWVVMQIGGKVKKSTRNLQDIRDTLKDILIELEITRKFTVGDKVDREM